MKAVLRNIVAVIAGLVTGSVVNMGLIIAGGTVVPAPAGVDVTDMESIQASIHLFGPQHFLFPFLAHALGTLAGAFVAALIAASQRALLALLVGALFLIGGVVNAFMIPAPVWFVVVDLVAAYVPMAWLGAKLRDRVGGK